MSPAPPPPAPTRRARGTVIVGLMWFVVTLADGVALTARLFLWPSTAPVERVDAVFVLAGDYGDRLGKGLELMGSGVAPTLVLDGQPDFAAVATLCQTPQPFEVVCLRPEPDSTRAEARAAAVLATQRGWTEIAVVTSKSHVTRAGLLFRRCLTADVTMVGTDPPYEFRVKLRAIRHEILGLANAVIRQRGC